MATSGQSPYLSATALVHHLACRHLTQLERARREDRLGKPMRNDPRIEVMIERGLAHEQAYIDHLKATGLNVLELAEHDCDSPQKVLEAMRAGVDAIIQAGLQDAPWRGRADVLLKVDTPSDLGAWSYEVVDTKLTQETKGGTVLQLCLYTELVGELQGLTPERMYVVKPGTGFAEEPFRFDDYGAYYRSVKKSLLATMAAPPDAESYPEPVTFCDICDWWPLCNQRRRDDDHLSFVAGLSSMHVAELRRQGITTLTAFGERDTALPQRPEQGNLPAYEKTHAQAQIQLQGRRTNKPEHELILPPEPGRGLARLPEPSPGDIFFDIEGDHFYEDGGLEYLFGYCYVDDNGKLQYWREWALSRADEKRMLELFLDQVMDCWGRYADMHIYHFVWD